MSLLFSNSIIVALQLKEFGQSTPPVALQTWVHLGNVYSLENSPCKAFKQAASHSNNNNINNKIYICNLKVTSYLLHIKLDIGTVRIVSSIL